MKKAIFILLIFLSLLNVSCVTDDTCTQTRYVKLTAGFYHVNYNDTTKVYSISSLSFDSLTVRGVKLNPSTNQYLLVDSILYNNSKNRLSSINLPLNNVAPQSKFKINFNAVIDTLTIYHSNINDYLSLECGCIITHAIDSAKITNHYIDSVRIINHDVNTLNAENIRLYK